MKVFITGANGFIGTLLTEKLLSTGHEVTAILRRPDVAAEFRKMGVTTVQGDISDAGRLRDAMNGCEWVFHLAAHAKPTSDDPQLPFRTNVTGTTNVLEAALGAGVKRIVITSTAGTMSYSRDGKAVDEETPRTVEYHTEYERTKAESEKIAKSFSTKLDVVIVNPSRVFGPGKLSKSNSITTIMKLYRKGLWRIIPGDGSTIGNYAFIDDVVNGHILAALHGRSGERYILGGENLSFNELFEHLGRATGSKRAMMKISNSGLKRIAGIVNVVSSVFGKQPVISSVWIDKYLNHWTLSSDKAIRELSYVITPFSVAAERTMVWLKNSRQA